MCTKWQVSSAAAQTDAGLRLFADSSERTHVICPTLLRKSKEKSCIAVHSKEFHPKPSRTPRPTVQLQSLSHAAKACAPRALTALSDPEKP